MLHLAGLSRNRLRRAGSESAHNVVQTLFVTWADISRRPTTIHPSATGCGRQQHAAEVMFLHRPVERRCPLQNQQLPSHGFCFAPAQEHGKTPSNGNVS